MIEDGATITCPYCGQSQWVAVDLDGGAEQSFVSDCEVCCNPILFRATVGAGGVVALDCFREDGGGA